MGSTAHHPRLRVLVLCKTYPRPKAGFSIQHTGVDISNTDFHSLTGHERDATGTQKAKDLATSQSNRKRGRPKASKLHKLKLGTPSGGNGKLSSWPATNSKLAYFHLYSWRKEKWNDPHSNSVGVFTLLSQCRFGRARPRGSSLVPGRRPGFPSGTQGCRYQQYVTNN